MSCSHTCTCTFTMYVHLCLHTLCDINHIIYRFVFSWRFVWRRTEWGNAHWSCCWSTSKKLERLCGKLFWEWGMSSTVKNWSYMFADFSNGVLQITLILNYFFVWNLQETQGTRKTAGMVNIFLVVNVVNVPLHWKPPK